MASNVPVHHIDIKVDISKRNSPEESGLVELRLASPGQVTSWACCCPWLDHFWLDARLLVRPESHPAARPKWRAGAVGAVDHMSACPSSKPEGCEGHL